MVKRWCVYLAGLLGVMIFYLANQLWLSWVLMWAVIALPGLSLLLSLPGMLCTRLMADCNAKTVAGADETVVVTGRCPLPMASFRYRLAVERVTTGERWVLSPGQLLPTEHCGKLRVRLEKARVYDYLGLFSLPIRCGGEVGVVVMPASVALSSPPGLERHMAGAWQVKPGGGYAENHELRLYRPGDPLRQVHWKLSAKTGKLVVREAMEPRRGKLLLTMDICGPAEALDEKFGQLLWLSSYLLERELRFEICILSGSGPAVECIATEADLGKAMVRFLSLPPVTEGSVLDRDRKCTWHFHIGGGTDEEK